MSSNSFVLDFSETDRSMIALVGGKGANLGELRKVESIHVPDGFCISTEAYKNAVVDNPAIDQLLNELQALKANERTAVAEVCARMREAIAAVEIPLEIREAIAAKLAACESVTAYAVRSSATAEDLPTASFAGQQDTFLNITGTEEILKHVSKCWASLFTDRAVIYRMQKDFDHRKVYLSVVVQRMIFPEVSGILFTADPVTSNRKVVSVDAGFGLGESLVSGIVNADVYKVRDGQIIDKKISAKQLAVHASPDGGTTQRAIGSEQQNTQALTDAQILQLEKTGRAIEAHFGAPQDIEWCLAEDTFHIVQSRPITTLFPLPEVNDGENHVYVSVGHQQMMTDAMKPMGLSFYLMVTRAPMLTAGGRLFVDVTASITSPVTGPAMMEMFGKADPLFTNALQTVLEREDFLKRPTVEQQTSRPVHKPALSDAPPIADDPSVPAQLISMSEASLEELKKTIATKSGTGLFTFIRQDIAELQRVAFHPQSMAAIKAAMDATTWLNEKMLEWLGEKGAADVLSQSAPNNITSEMGLALLDVADAIRPHQEVMQYLPNANDEHFFEALSSLRGGEEVKHAIENYLRKYGMRCAGEIDISRKRWSEKPTTLVPLLVSNIRNFEPGESKRRFEQGLREAQSKKADLLRRLRQFPDGTQKAQETERMISRLSTFIGYREYPKYAMISRYFVYKQALLKEADRLVQHKVIHERDDIFYLTFNELEETVGANEANEALISKRKEEFVHYEKLSPPRVLTSDGETVSGAFRSEHIPADAIAGLAVSSGVVEGRARVILNMEDATLEEGDILVTAFTDPSWTPLFVSIKGLVTEVGGLMTHGAVIAREYGLPAVVSVEHATKRIRDGQRIRVNGTEGYVEFL